MTKGELPLLPGNQNPDENGNNGCSSHEIKETHFNEEAFYKTEQDLAHSSCINWQTAETIEVLGHENKPSYNTGARNSQINIADYVQNLPNDSVKQKIARILSNDEDDESLYDIENIQHYLLVGRRTSSDSILKCCENKLLSNLDSTNCRNYYVISMQYDLPVLEKAAQLVIKSKEGSSKSDNASQAEVDSTLCQPEMTVVCSSSDNASQPNNIYIALFTCSEYGSKRTVTTVVYDTKMKIKCYKDLMRGKRISNQFQCCCLQSDYDSPPKIIYSFGKSVYEYDPITNERNKRANLGCKRSNFCMVAYDNKCFVIGGVYQSHKVLEIEEQVCCKKHSSWKIVARLPGDTLPINASCVVFGDAIYIFSAVLTIEGTVKPNTTSVYIFHPIKKTVKLFSEIPISLRQIKTCVHGSFIYMASDQKHLLKFSPLDGTYTVCADQIFECKDFGFFTLGNNILLAGGIKRDGTSNDIIRSFSTSSASWTTLPEKLPDCMAIYGASEIKIPKSVGFIVPFGEENVFKKGKSCLLCR